MTLETPNTPNTLDTLDPLGTPQNPAPIEPWLSIIGIGEAGLGSLSPQALQALQNAELVWGGQRHLRLAHIDPVRARPWPSPLTSAYGDITKERGRPVAVLASGDPFSYGIGSVLAKHVRPAEINSFPVPGALSLAAARLGWALQEAGCLTLHGRPLETLRPHLHRGAKLLVLSWDETTPQALCQYLTRHGFGGTKVTVLEALGGPQERIRQCIAADFDLTDVQALNTLALVCSADDSAKPLPLSCGLADTFFDHDGQITKSPVRALTLSALAPQPGALLWDIGLGSGSVAIEWLLRHPQNRAIGIEKDPGRAARARCNATLLGVPHLTVRDGAAPTALGDLEPPDAIFIGGGASTPGVLDLVMEKLKTGGALVINAVTLETEALLAAQHQRYGGDLLRFDIAQAEHIGNFRGWRASMPVTQWRWIKP